MGVVAMQAAQAHSHVHLHWVMTAAMVVGVTVGVAVTAGVVFVPRVLQLGQLLVVPTGGPAAMVRLSGLRVLLVALLPVMSLVRVLLSPLRPPTFSYVWQWVIWCRLLQCRLQ
jgi:hypothetical protein